MSYPCPFCKKIMDPPKCRSCGAEQKLDESTGNVIWMRRGRLLAAPADEKAHWEQHADKHGIEKDDPRYPEKFK